MYERRVLHNKDRHAKAKLWLKENAPDYVLDYLDYLDDELVGLRAAADSLYFDNLDLLYGQDDP